ncbi:unnamed protein product [Parajaminaea phylloscopi]
MEDWLGLKLVMDGATSGSVRSLLRALRPTQDRTPRDSFLIEEQRQWLGVISPSRPLFLGRLWALRSLRMTSTLAATIGGAYSAHLKDVNARIEPVCDSGCATGLFDAGSEAPFFALTTSSAAEEVLLRLDCQAVQLPPEVRPAPTSERGGSSLSDISHEVTLADVWPLLPSTTSSKKLIVERLNREHLALTQKLSVALANDDACLPRFSVHSSQLSDVMTERLDLTAGTLRLPTPDGLPSMSGHCSVHDITTKVVFGDCAPAWAASRSNFQRPRFRPLPGLTSLNIELRDQWWHFEHQTYIDISLSPDRLSFPTEALDYTDTAEALSQILVDDDYVERATTIYSSAAQTLFTSHLPELEPAEHQSIDVLAVRRTTKSPAGPEQTTSPATVSIFPQTPSQEKTHAEDRQYDHLYPSQADSTSKARGSEPSRVSTNLWLGQSLSPTTTQTIAIADAAPPMTGSIRCSGANQTFQIACSAERQLSSLSSLVNGYHSRSMAASGRKGKRRRLDPMSAFLRLQGRIRGSSEEDVPEGETAGQPAPDTDPSNSVDLSRDEADRPHLHKSPPRSPLHPHHYLVTLRGIQNQAVMRRLQQACQVYLVECESSEAHKGEVEVGDLILDAVTNVIIFKLTHLPAAMRAPIDQHAATFKVPADLNIREWLLDPRYDRTLVILESYSSSDHRVVQETVPLRRAREDLERFARADHSSAAKTSTKTVEIAVATSPLEAAQLCRNFADKIEDEAKSSDDCLSFGEGAMDAQGNLESTALLSQETRVTPGKTWKFRDRWLDQVSERDCQALQFRSGLNPFAAALILAARGSFRTFLVDPPSRRLADFGLVVGQDRIARFNAATRCDGEEERHDEQESEPCTP